MRRLLLVSALAAACLHVPRALAAGLGIPDLGAGPMASGAANIAAPSDLSAIYYNPAALASQSGLRAMLDLRLVRHQLTFQRLDEFGENPQEFAKVENGGPLGVAPMFVVSYQLKPEGLFPISVAIGGYPASGYSGYQFPDSELIRATKPADGQRFDRETAQASPQRYAMISANSLSYTLAVAVAAQVKPWLDVGFTLQNPLVHFRSRQAIYGNPFAGGEQYAYDALLDLDASDYLTLAGSLGASLRLPGGLVVGASVQLPTTIEAEGTLDLKIGAPLQAVGARVEGNATSLQVKLPLIARLGARLVRQAFEAELAFTYDAWSRYDELVVTPKDIFFVQEDGTRTAVSQIRLPKKMQDAQSLRLGGVVKPGAFVEGLKFLTIRIGVLAETSAVPDQRISLDQAHWERLAASFGLGFALENFDVIVGWSHFIQPDKEIRNSAVAQSTPLRKDKDPPIFVGNGDYHSQIDLFGVSVAARFGGDSK